MREGDAFLDIGAGDGAPTLAAALLYPKALRASRGVEIVAPLVERARRHRAALLHALGDGDAAAAGGDDDGAIAPTEFALADVHDDAEDGRAAAILRDTTLAVCFATTWSSGSPRRALPRLSAALARRLPAGARVVVVDGRLDESDGFRWEGELKLHCADTLPHSYAQLFVLEEAR